jgi:copper chaperone
MTELRFRVPGISCPHCVTAITAEVAKAPGVETVQLEPGTNWVVVCGQDLDIEGIRAAVAEAGHQAEL